jgi:hypothetical protein
VSYWGAKSDLDFMLRFRADVFELFEHEGKAAKELRESAGYISRRELKDAVKSVASTNDPTGYQAVRQRLAVGMSRAVRIGRELGIPAELRSYPPPAIGGPVIDVNVFEATLNDPSWGGVDRQHTVDTLNRAVGACAERVRVERLHALNPAWWLWSLVSFVLRIPFILLSATGLRVGRFESSVGGIVVKVVEAVAIAFVLVKLGLSGS